MAAVDGLEEGCVLDAGEDGVPVGKRRLEVPDPGEFPWMLRAVVPLVRARLAVVGELVADRLPGLAAVVRPLDDLTVPAGRLARVQPVRIDRRAFQVVHLPAREKGAFDVPGVPLPVRRQHESAFARADEEPHSAHPNPPSRSITTFSPTTFGGLDFRPRWKLDRCGERKSSAPKERGGEGGI